jgi:tetratricopeptide (TPR) repeat protein
MRIQRLLLLVLVLAVPVSGTAADSTSGQKLLAAGRADDAISALEAQVRSNPEDAASYNLLARAYYSVGNWDRAIQAAEKSVALAPANSEFYHWLGRIYGEKADSAGILSAMGWARKCRAAFERAVELDGKNIDARVDLAEFYIEAPGIVGGGQDKARAQAEALNRLDPAKAHWVYARLAEKNKDTATAEREYRAALDATTDKGWGWLNLALFYRRMSRWEDMENAVQKAISAPHADGEVFIDGAQTLLRAGRNFSGAAEILRRYIQGHEHIEKAPVFKAHYVLGNLLARQGDKQGAAAEYQAALALARDYKPAREALKKL